MLTPDVSLNTEHRDSTRNIRKFNQGSGWEKARKRHMTVRIHRTGEP